MSDYIKREDAINAIRDVMKQEKHLKPPIYDAIKNVQSVPSADVVEVVRCKDCKFNKGKNKCLNEHSIIDIPKDGDYCSYGERKEREHE